MAYVARAALAFVFGLLGYAFPRLLVAAGVPLDKWINEFGGFLGQQAWFNFQSVLFGFSTLFALVMLWVEGRFSLLEQLSYAARPIRLSEQAVRECLALREQGESLVNENRLEGDAAAAWQQNVVEWNTEIERLIERELPRNELISYQTVNLRPALSQTQKATLASLTGRLNKLRAMIMRLLPRQWTR